MLAMYQHSNNMPSTIYF